MKDSQLKRDRATRVGREHTTGRRGDFSVRAGGATNVRHCYLMALQGHIWGVAMAASDMLTAMGLEALLYLGLFSLLAALLGKTWCGGRIGAVIGKGVGGAGLHPIVAVIRPQMQRRLG